MFSPQERAVIQALQSDLPLKTRPFQFLAEQTGLREEEVIETIKGLRRKGVIRRVGAVLGHRKLGFRANALVLWDPPSEKVDETGQKLASFPEISHCYLRKVPKSWSYRLFTMVHGRTREACLVKIRKISRELGLENYQVIFSTFEFKKSGMEYHLRED